jgi:hypothetical protein
MGTPIWYFDAANCAGFYHESYSFTGTNFCTTNFTSGEPMKDSVKSILIGSGGLGVNLLSSCDHNASPVQQLYGDLFSVICRNVTQPIAVKYALPIGATVYP